MWTTEAVISVMSSGLTSITGIPTSTGPVMSTSSADGVIVGRSMGTSAVRAVRSVISTLMSSRNPRVNSFRSSGSPANRSTSPPSANVLLNMAVCSRMASMNGWDVSGMASRTA